MQPANPLDSAAPMGALVSDRHLRRVHEMVQRASSESGAPVIGGEPVLRETGGSYFPPTVFTGVDPASTIAQEEVFGPVLAVTTFRDEDEAVAMANSTAYGLGSAVWTRDLNRAHRMSSRIRAGMVWVNCYEEGDLTMPFGGVKLSGLRTRQEPARPRQVHRHEGDLDRPHRLTSPRPRRLPCTPCSSSTTT